MHMIVLKIILNPTNSGAQLHRFLVINAPDLEAAVDRASEYAEARTWEEKRPRQIRLHQANRLAQSDRVQELFDAILLTPRAKPRGPKLMREANLLRQVEARLKAHGILYRKRHGTRNRRPGRPRPYFLYRDVHVEIELKAPAPNIPPPASG
jgi:hypothetical protein